jgi:hypothetical protein
MESDLTSFHACCLLEVGPGSVDNCDIVLLISYVVSLMAVSRQYKQKEIKCYAAENHTLNTVCLDKLSTVF